MTFTVMELGTFSLEYFIKRIRGLDLSQIREMTEETNIKVQFSDRLFKDKYIVAGQYLYYRYDVGSVGPEYVTVYLIDISDGSVQEIFKSNSQDDWLVGVDVSPNKQSLFIMTKFDDFPNLMFMGQKNVTDLDCDDLIDVPILGDSKPRWSNDEDIILFYNDISRKMSSIKIDWDNKRALCVL